MNEKIKFGTDGWRAIIAKEYTLDNVARVAEATALWLTKNYPGAAAVVGHDCRFAGEMFAETTAVVMAQKGIKVFLAKGFVSTPMISLGTNSRNAAAGIIITASHNPPSYNGYKIKAGYGGPATPAMIDEVESLIPDTMPVPTETVDTYVAKGLIEYIDLEAEYIAHVEKNFDLELIRKSGIEVAYDAMYGAGQNVMRRLFPDATFLHCDNNPGFDGQAPEPIDKNLVELRETIKAAGDIDFGLATDGDADRIGLYNAHGKFIDSHHIILLLINYLVTQKGLTGKVAVSFSCTDKIKDLCKHMGLEAIITKIGFKYICEYMVEDDVLVGGEESGGIAIKGHIPERDGLWIGLTLLEYMAKTGKSLDELIDEVYAIVGPFAMERVDHHISETQKQTVLANCKAGNYKAFDKIAVESVEDIDGWKFHLGNSEWVMIRASGTEPVLRTYCQAASSERAFKVLDILAAEILK
jgi:phosphomannomutase